mgnify:CR=1 FL=1
MVDAVWAHSWNSRGERHSLRDHLLGTAALARQFGEAFGAGDLCSTVGLLHDAGKVAPAWQERLTRLAAGVPAARVDHKRLGAGLAYAPCRAPGGLAIMGHHGGMPDAGGDTVPTKTDDELRERVLAEVPEIASVLAGPAPLLPAHWTGDPTLAEMATRMVHSTLVDADYLDTSAHFLADRVKRPAQPGMDELVERFEGGRSSLLSRRRASPIDRLRETVYEQCLAAAVLPPGLFRLPAPTGSGKTIASAGFALHHAAAHGLRRVVVAVPFLSITEQNAEIYRRLLGNDVVLEHHSAVEPGSLARYGVENWDAPFVVTTTVQLFESLFSNRPSRTRKLHRLVRSVIVLDEVQAIPLHFLPTILDGLRLLCSYFGATVLLASATQPTVEALGPLVEHGVRPTEIISDPPQLYADMARVRPEWVTVPTSVEVADLVARERQALLVVSTTSSARDLARLLIERGVPVVRHLSTRMCQAHRRAVLAEVRARLAADEGVVVVSTSLIEAGVDVDFPVVFRSLAPAESLLQAAGRANREGLRPSGRLVVLDCPEIAPLRAHETAVAVTRQHFRPQPGSLNDPVAMTRYYTDLFGSLALEDQALHRRLHEARRRLALATVAEQFRMIDDDSVSVFVAYDPVAAALLDALGDEVERTRTVDVATLRRLQPYVVNLPTRLAAGPEVAGYLTHPVPGLARWEGPYDPLLGVVTDAPVHDTVW